MKNIKKTCHVLMIFACMVSLFSIHALAASSSEQVYKVGSISFDKYGYTDANGDYRGFDPEFAQKIAQYGYYRIKMVPYGNVDTALSDLESGKIDMVMDCVKTPDREKRFLYSDQSLVTQSSTIYTNYNDSRFKYDDLSALNGKKVGCMHDEGATDAFRELMTSTGVSATIVEFDSSSKLTDALKKHKIDAGVTGSFVPNGFKSIYSFDPEASYVLFRKGNTALKARVDDAMGQLYSENPGYADSIFNKYLVTSSASMRELSSSEQSYIRIHPRAKVAIVRNTPPFFSVKNDKPTGIIPDYYDVLSKKTGLKFTFVSYDSIRQAKKAVKNGDADILGFYFGDTISASGEGLLATDPYTTFDCMIVKLKGHTSTPETAAVTERSINMINVSLESNGRKIKLQEYHNIDDCYSALKEGRVDSVICSMTSATWLMNRHANRVVLSTLPGVSIDICAAVSPKNNTLRSILSKGIDASESDINRIITENNATGKQTLETFIESTSANMIILFFGILSALVIGLVLSLLALHRRQKEQTGIAAEKARNKQREIELAAMETHNEELNQFFSSISHDMRTPLNAILGFSDLARKADISDETREYLNKISASGNLLVDLVNDTLTLSKINSGKMQIVEAPVVDSEILDTVITTIASAAESKNIDFTVNNTTPRRTVFADKINTQKILLNILSNAVKYTPSGGKVTFTIRKSPSDIGKDDTLFIIEDTGIGMNEEFLSHLYEPFVQEDNTNSKATGTGLGLSIVKQLVDMMGGTIDVESRKYSGTKFTVRLHFKDASEYAAAVETHRDIYEPVSFSGEKILVCEDNIMNTEIARSILQTQGLNVVTAENGKEGYDIFSSSAIWEYDAIIMDIRMPIMTGYAATRAIRALKRPDAENIPVIALSADAFDEDIKKCTESGMDAHISKPFNPEEIYSVLYYEIKKARDARNTSGNL